MTCFQKLFLETTDPDTNFERLLQKDVFLSIVIHTISYVFFVYLFSNIFNLKITNKTYAKIIIFLLIIMIIGYIGRLSRVKSLRNAYISLGENKENANIQSKNLLRNAYYKFYFLG